MSLIMILGPMKSGKSFELISHFLPLKYTDIPFGLFQSAKNIRDENIWSRGGLQLMAQKVKSLAEILKCNLQEVGIDEIHMFKEQEAKTVGELLKRETNVVISGLDTDYKGKMFQIVKRLFELGPDEVRYKKAVCESCRKFKAVFTQVLRGNSPILSGLPAVVPDDGTYTYKPLCRNCFK